MERLREEVEAIVGRAGVSRRPVHDLWPLRLMRERSGDHAPDVLVARTASLLPDLYQAVKGGLAQTAPVALCHFSHAYPQGCCAYFTFAGAADTEAAAQDAYRACWDQAMEACRAHGATIGHHHGVGQARAAWARREMGGWEPFWSALRDAVDPAHVMSPRGAGGR